MSREISAKSRYAFLLGWARELEPGKAHLARLGKEFDCMATSFTGAVYAAAATRGLKATVAVFPDQGAVVFAFYRADSFTRPNLAAYPIVKKMRKF